MKKKKREQTEKLSNGGQNLKSKYMFSFVARWTTRLFVQSEANICLSFHSSAHYIKDNARKTKYL